MSAEWSFKRSISPEMINSIREAYADHNSGNSWIRQYIDDKDLYATIRNETVNFYYKGNSILELCFKGKHLRGNVHYKYLLRPYLKKKGGDDQPYVSSQDEVVLPVIDPKIEGASAMIKDASKPYRGQEKEGIHNILRANDNIVDVEITFSRENNRGQLEKGKKNRLDFCALRRSGNSDELELCFYEAKHFSNSELRAKGKPKVVEQIERYKRTISAHLDEIKLAYKSAFKAITATGIPYPAIDNVTLALCSDFTVSSDVRLVVFGFDQSQKDGFKDHRSNLISHGVKPGLILMKGDAKDFKTGISN